MGGLDASGVTDEGAAGSASTPAAPDAGADAGGAVDQPPALEGCGVEPVTPNATQETRNVLCYLHSIYGNHILSGQEENNDDNYQGSQTATDVNQVITEGSAVNQTFKARLDRTAAALQLPQKCAPRIPL
jgi:hypothetical protein